MPSWMLDVVCRRGGYRGFRLGGEAVYPVEVYYGLDRHFRVRDSGSYSQVRAGMFRIEPSLQRESLHMKHPSRILRFTTRTKIESKCKAESCFLFVDLLCRTRVP